MPTMANNDNEVLAALEALDETYARSEWYPEATTWDDAGVYKGIAKFIGLSDGDLHLDLGSGYGVLCFELREKCRQAILWAVDRNLAMVRRAEVLARHFGFRYETHAQQGLRTTKDRQSVEAIFVPDPSRIGKMHPFESGGPIQFIVDDLRQMDVVKTILGERKIDSCSFVFPGYGTRSIYEVPFELSDNVPGDAECKTRMTLYIQLVREAAYHFASRRTKEGGQFVVVERLPMASRDEAVRTVTGLLGNYGRYWSLTDAMELGGIKRPDGRSWNVPVIAGATIDSPVSYGYAFKLRRNEVPFEE